MIHAVLAFVDRTTMYRLVLYYLLALFVAALGFSIAGVLPHAWSALLWSALVLLVCSWATNRLLAWGFDAVTNGESVFITPLILLLVLSPVSVTDVSGSLSLALIAAGAMASKYVLAIGKKHVLNPAAIALVGASYGLGVHASWWVAGNLPLLPFIFIGGVLVVHKLRKADVVVAFGATVLLAVVFTAIDPWRGVMGTVLHTSLFYFAFVMLTEPLTMPPTRLWRILYGALVGLLFVPAVAHLSPELALVIGNLFSYCVSPKGRYMLSFVQRSALANGMYEYLFTNDRPLHFRAGQYLEWTLKETAFDNRGNRRYFTVASAPGAEQIALGVRFYDKPSAFKRALATLPVGAKVSVASLAGDFTLPGDTKKKLAFLAGGIGVTPFASMARYMVATGEARDAVLLYSSKTASEIAYQDVFAAAAPRGLRTVYALSDEASPDPSMYHGFISADLITQKVPDHAERLFYISGPPGMVNAMKKMLLTLGVSRWSIKTDFFPGLA